MSRRLPVLVVAACVVLAGCATTNAHEPTPENPQTTLEPSATKTVPDPPYRLELRGRSDDPVQVTVTLSSVDNETVYYENRLTLNPDGTRYFGSQVENRSRFRATVSVEGDSLSLVVGPDEGYSVWVQNRSALTSYESGGDGDDARSGGGPSDG